MTMDPQHTSPFTASPMLVREIHPVVKVVDDAAGLVDYVASDETIDSYAEIIRARGWRFDLFRKNAPFVDSHDYSTIEKLLGTVVDFRVVGAELIERVQYARFPDTLADWAYRMVRDGFLKAVSVGFRVVRMASRFDSDKGPWITQLAELKLNDQAGVRAIYIEQQQIELSQCILGANPNALARAYKGGCLSDEDIDNLSRMIAKAKTGASAKTPAGADTATLQRAQLAILATIHTHL